MSDLWHEWAKSALLIMGYLCNVKFLFLFENAFVIMSYSENRMPSFLNCVYKWICPLNLTMENFMPVHFINIKLRNTSTGILSWVQRPIPSVGLPFYVLITTSPEAMKTLFPVLILVFVFCIVIYDVINAYNYMNSSDGVDRRVNVQLNVKYKSDWPDHG